MRKTMIYYFLFMFFLLSIFVSGVIDSQDGFQYLAVARNIYYKGKPTSPIYEYDTFKNIHMPAVIGKDGESYSFTGLGFSVAMLPAVGLADVFYKIYNIAPPQHFPLENDWLILLFASFTNALIGAFLAVIMFLYLIKLKIPKNQALILSTLSIVATNLFVYTKHILAHMMFTTFLLTSFYLLRSYLERRKNNSNQVLMISSGICLGIVMITYNATYLLTFPPFLLYYLLLSKPSIKIIYFKNLLKDVFLFMVGFIPLLFIHLWFENLRVFGEGISLASSSYFEGYAKTKLLNVPIPIIFEGIWGQLFSPGRSVFLFSPLLLIIIIFWYRIKTEIKAELIVFLSLFIIYILFYASQFSVGPVGYGVKSMWSGESSWGPRYLVPIIPFGMLVVGYLYTKISKLHKLVIFTPLVIAGLIIQLLGILTPYQVKFHNLEKKFFVNATEYTNYDYINIIPRYSPIIGMSKSLIKNASLFPRLIDNGMHNTRFIDGIDFPFDVGQERWRVIENTGYILIDNSKDDPITKLTIDLINHPIETSTASASLTFLFNGKKLNDLPYELAPTVRSKYEFNIKSSDTKEKDNTLLIKAEYPDYEITKYSRQIVGIISFSINDYPQNLESIDVPYVSALGPKMMNVNYANWGGENNDPWRYWGIHTQMFERLPDLWWIRNLFYWDIPKKLIISLFSINLLGLGFSYYKLRNTVRN